MQYKIPIQIENEDVIVAWLSLRQIVIIMVWWWLAYVVFKNAEPRVGATLGLTFSIPLAVIGIVIALVKVSEMTFLPLILNYFRMFLNSRERKWSQWVDSYSELKIGYVTPPNQKKVITANKSFKQTMSDELMENIENL